MSVFSALDFKTFRCGTCGTEVTNLLTSAQLIEVMRVHAELCAGCPEHPARPSQSEGALTSPGGSGVVGVGEAGS